jgi:hypothetical protein
VRSATGPPRPPSGGSGLRLIFGATLLIVALAVAVYGFVSLVQVLDHGGYGTPAMRRALAALGVAGACIAAGIATIIWDISKRYETPT